MKILLLDIETAPAIAYIWSMRDKFIPLDRLIEPGYTLCYTAKWLGEKEVFFDSIRESRPKDMLKGIWRMLNEADSVIHYNGISFDIPVLEGEFLKHRLKPPSPYHQIDLYQTVKRFRLISRKLDYVTRMLDLGRKVEHKGMDLWKSCMGGDNEAWDVMEKYNRQDVKLLEDLYFVLRPWIRNHPNLAIESGEEVCSHCGSDNLKWKGYRESITRKYRRFVCRDCGAWGRAVKCERGTAKVRGF